MARLKPNLNVMKMTGLAIAFTYFGAFAFADAWGLTIQEVIDKHPFYFYGAMACFVTLFLQGEIQEQKEKMALEQTAEEVIKVVEKETKVEESTPKPKRKKRSNRNKK